MARKDRTNQTFQLALDRAKRIKWTLEMKEQIFFQDGNDEERENAKKAISYTNKLIEALEVFCEVWNKK